MFAGGETVLIGVSGGADSVALLHVMLALAAEWRFELRVLHVDHRLRGDSARDAEFVRDLVRRLGVPVEIATITVDNRGSVEAAARAARYRALEAAADRSGAQRIAVAHTADDQAETVLMRVLEGAGVRGLAGIPPVRGRIVRPLIRERRAALVEALRGAGLDWIEDPTNRDPRFLRNRIRHELLPALAGFASGDVVEALERVAGFAREVTDTFERLAAAELDRHARMDDAAIVVPVAALDALPRRVAAEVLRQMALRLGSRAPLRAWAHRGLARALARPTPRPFRVGGVTVEMSAGWIRVSVRAPAALPARAVPVPGTVALPEAGLRLHSMVVSPVGFEIPRVPHEVAFDADLLSGPLVVRGRRRGDRLVPFGGRGERRLKTMLIDVKLPRWERARVPIVEAGSEIIWAAGVRRGAAAPVTRDTRRILYLTVQPLAEEDRGR